MTYRLRINGTSVANPAEGGIKITDEPVWADGAGRNVSTGEMIATLVCWKRQVEVTWNTLTFTEAKEYFKDKEISPQEYLYYQGVLMTAMKKQDYKRLFECLKQKPNSSVFEFKEA